MYEDSWLEQRYEDLTWSPDYDPHDYFNEERDYDEEAYWAAEIEREAQAEAEHERQCIGKECHICYPVVPEIHEGHPRVWPNYIDEPDF